MINSTSNAVVRESYLKFWFTNDSVTKWETYGVDYSTDVANPNFKLEDFKRIETERGKIISRNKKVGTSIYLSVILGFVALLIFKN
jgi:threonyl-tRNA synthetase